MSKQDEDAKSAEDAPKAGDLTISLKQARNRQLRRVMLTLLTIVLILASGMAAGLYSMAISFDIRPGDAQETVTMDLSANNGFLAFGNVYLFEGSGVLSLEADGFIPRQITLEGKDRGKEKVIRMEEKDAEVSLRFTPQDRRSRYALFDETTRVLEESGETLSFKMPPGQYRLFIDNPLAQTKEIPLTLSRGQVLNDHVLLNPWRGQLSVITTPEGAAISLDDTPVGQGPYEANLEGKRYALKVEAQYYETVEESVRLDRWNGSQELNIEMKLSPVFVTFEVEPAGGTLLINGRETEAGVPIRMAANDKYRIRYQKQGFSHKRATLPLALEDAGREKRFKISLTDGAVYEAVAEKLEADTKEELPPIVSGMPDRYESSSGLDYILFSPGLTFTLGAERHQDGAKANEFLRSYALNRPFYMAETEVTNRAFKKFRKNHLGADGEPVTMVSLDEMRKFANWQSEQDGYDPAYLESDGNIVGIDPLSIGYRLPLEAEWEWLARQAGRREMVYMPWHKSATDQNLSIPSNFANLAGVEAIGRASTYIDGYDDRAPTKSPVRAFGKEASGLYDMHGNVSEVMEDQYSLAPPPEGTILQQELPSQLSTLPVLKGGNYLSGNLTTIRPSWRDRFTGPVNKVGFRLARFAQ